MNECDDVNLNDYNRTMRNYLLIVYKLNVGSILFQRNRWNSVFL